MGHTTHRHDLDILIVDDDDLVLSMMIRGLEDRFRRVVAHRAPADALAELRDGEHGFDILLTDIAMPGMSGTELAQAALQHTPELTVLFISGFISQEQERGLPFGARLLGKPFTPSELVAFLTEDLPAGLDPRS